MIKRAINNRIINLNSQGRTINTRFAQNRCLNWRTDGGLGPELVVNGGFSVGTGWSLTSGWSISGGTSNYDGVTGNGVCRQQGFSFVNPVISFDVIVSAGKTARLRVYNYAISNNFVVSGDISSTGSYSISSDQILAIENQTITIMNVSGAGICMVGYTSGDDFKIDNVSIKEIL